MDKVIEVREQVETRIVSEIYHQTDLKLGACVSLARIILDLRYPNGNPMLAILDEEQELPDTPQKDFMDRPHEISVPEGYYWGQTDLVAQGWRKTVNG